MENRWIKYFLNGVNSCLLAVNIGYFLPVKIELFSQPGIWIQLILILVVFISAFFLISSLTNEWSGIKLEFPSMISTDTADEKSIKSMLSTIGILAHKEKFPGFSQISEFINRTKRLVAATSEEKTFNVLFDQYNSAVENEKFYERTIWRIASIFIPVSLSLPVLNFDSTNYFIQLGAGFVIYLIFLFLFQRFRISIRLFREYAMFLEDLLGLYSHNFVYKHTGGKFKIVLRVWTILVNIGVLYFSVFLYFLINN